MLWRTPWLRPRIVLLGMAAWDALSLYIAYNITYLIRLGRWEGLNLGISVMGATWLGFSYLLGQYSPTTTAGRSNIFTKVAATVFAGTAVTALFVAHSWIYQIVDAQTRYRGFLIPFVVGTSVLSLIGQILESGLIQTQREWILVVKRQEEITLLKELKVESRALQARTNLVDPKQFGEAVKPRFFQGKGIVVGDVQAKDHLVIRRILQFREQGKCILPLLSWCEQELQRIPPELIHAEWLIQAEGFGLRPGSISWRVKRFGDVIGAIALIAVTVPLVVIAGLLVWLEDRGPMFYKQVRSGLYGTEIRIWKIRSMKVNSERSGAQWASRYDPRVTRIGRIIRATRIDELPQLFSVVNGDLSLIGPRPERPEIEQRLQELIPNYRVRHWIRPGLSGWAQVCYPYGASTEDSRMKLSYDLYYLRNANLLLDILITIKTIRLVVSGKGASPKGPQ